MHTIVLRLDPRLMANPDLDIRYVLPDLLSERSAGVISDDGYDYVGDRPYLVLFLHATALEPAVVCVRDVIENVRVLDNDLRPGVVAAVEHEGRHEVIYPAGFEGPFLPG
jgi:hypothetical protein